MQDVQTLPARDCWFTVDHLDEATIVRFTNADMRGLDSTEAMELRLFRLAEGVGRRLFVLNFGAVPRLTSSLLGKLIGLQKRVQNAGGLLTLCSLAPPLQSQFERTRLNTLFTICADEQEALHVEPQAKTG